jgi:serine/threonine-protein kinase
MTDESSKPLRTCPDREELLAYNLGRLPKPRSEEIGRHVVDCPLCGTILAEQALEEDTLIGLVRQWAQPTPGEVREGEPVTASEATVPTWPASGQPVPLGVFGKFELLELLPPGGMAVVHKARDQKLGWIVALKRPKADLTPAARERFLREGRAIASLKHPNIVEIRDLNEINGEPYQVLEYMEGGSLAGELKRREEEGRPYDAKESAVLVECLARAVQYAHEHGILHRDLKPGNVLLTADGTPKIADFGLAKMLDADLSATASEALLGTVPYMAPEQAAGRQRDLGFHTDVWALGVILYRLLTGHLPFQGSDHNQTLQLIQNEAPEPPSKHCPGLDRDLEAVCLECLEKKPGRRYRTAGALAGDLAAWRRGEPVSVRPRGFLGRTFRTVRRHAVSVVLALVLLLAGGLTVAGLWYFGPDRAAREIERELAQGDRVTLIDAKGPPRWSRVRVSDDQTNTFVSDADGFYTVASQDLTLVELVRSPRPPLSRYRLRAWVRMERSGDHQAKVGLYVRHRELPSPSGPGHALLQFSYNDLNNESAKPKDEKEKPEEAKDEQTPPPPGNTLMLWPCLYGRRGRGHTEHKLNVLTLPRFLLGKQRPPTWRSLRVDVTPEDVRCVWEEIEVGPLALARLEGKLAPMLANLKGAKSTGLDLPPADCFPVEGGLGLFVYRAVASFHTVTIEPLPLSPNP